MRDDTPTYAAEEYRHGADLPPPDPPDPELILDMGGPAATGTLSEMAEALRRAQAGIR